MLLRAARFLLQLLSVYHESQQQAPVGKTSFMEMLPFTHGPLRVLVLPSGLPFSQPFLAYVLFNLHIIRNGREGNACSIGVEVCRLGDSCGEA